MNVKEFILVKADIYDEMKQKNIERTIALNVKHIIAIVEDNEYNVSFSMIYLYDGIAYRAKENINSILNKIYTSKFA